MAGRYQHRGGPAYSHLARRTGRRPGICQCLDHPDARRRQSFPGERTAVAGDRVAAAACCGGAATNLSYGSRPLEWCMRCLLSPDRFVLGGRVAVT